MYSRIAGTGQFVPGTVLTNADLVKRLKDAWPNDPSKWTSEEWIVERTGIKERRIARADETNATMGAEALKNALDDAKIGAEKLEMIIVATNSNRERFPSCAGQIQKALKAPETCGVFDLQAGCTGFSYGLAVADAFIRTGIYRTMAVVGTDKLSDITDYTDRETCILFGDLACAWILTSSEVPGIIRSRLYGRGTDCDKITVSDKDCITMKGKDVFKFATTVLPQVCVDVLKDTFFSLGDVKRIFPHNANVRIIDYAAERLAKESGIPLKAMQEKFYHTTGKYGNASAGSNANSFHEARKQGVVKEGDLCMLVGFGAGLTYGANLFIL